MSSQDISGKMSLIINIDDREHPTIFTLLHEAKRGDALLRQGRSGHHWGLAPGSNVVLGRARAYWVGGAVGGRLRG